MAYGNDPFTAEQTAAANELSMKLVSLLLHEPDAGARMVATAFFLMNVAAGLMPAPSPAVRKAGHAPR